jgi:hypothetical protein
MRFMRLAWCLALVLVAATAAVASAGPYFNSSEPGCNGSDPNVLMCDDFEDGVWYGRDGDHATAEDDGWWGTIYANPITPPTPPAVAPASRPSATARPAEARIAAPAAGTWPSTG